MNQRTAETVLEQIMGYDARDYRDDLLTLWPEQRREGFLYRRDVRKVLSVDTAVWPSLFAGLVKPAPPHQESLQDLWASESTLREALSKRALDEVLPAFRTTAVTLVLDDGQTHPFAHELATFVEPPNNVAKWQFVGFDVADALLLSALSNCGFLPGYDDTETMRQVWSPHLNEFHLFHDAATASAFRRMADIRLAGDHAPTFVYGIHLLKLGQ